MGGDRPMSHPFEEPESMHDDINYTRPFLKEVIARIDFVAPIDALTTSLPPKLASAASKLFPIAEPLDGFAQELHLGAGEVHHLQSSFKEWRFFGKNREKQFFITAESMFITIKQYSSYETLRDHWTALVNSVSKEFPDSRAGRFGLRYINSIEIQDSPKIRWDQYINASLVASGDFFDQYSVTRLFHIAGLKFDDLDMTFQFGLPNPDYPSVMRKPLFILDLDCHITSSHEFSESLINMDKAHSHIQTIFEASITDKLRSIMND